MQQRNANRSGHTFSQYRCRRSGQQRRSDGQPRRHQQAVVESIEGVGIVSSTSPLAPLLNWRSSRRSAAEAEGTAPFPAANCVAPEWRCQQYCAGVPRTMG